MIYDAEILENHFQKMCNARKKLVEPLIEPINVKINRFMGEVYEPSIFEEDDETEFYTLRNERVRSKSYIEKNIRKLDIYERNGFLLGENLLLTHETSKVPLSRSVLNSYIENYLL